MCELGRKTEFLKTKGREIYVGKRNKNTLYRTERNVVHKMYNECSERSEKRGWCKDNTGYWMIYAYVAMMLRFSSQDYGHPWIFNWNHEVTLDKNGFVFYDNCALKNCVQFRKVTATLKINFVVELFSNVIAILYIRKIHNSSFLKVKQGQTRNKIVIDSSLHSFPLPSHSPSPTTSKHPFLPSFLSFSVCFLGRTSCSPGWFKHFR